MELYILLAISVLLLAIFAVIKLLKRRRHIIWLRLAKEELISNDVCECIGEEKDYIKKISIALKKDETNVEEVVELLKKYYLCKAKKWLKNTEKGAAKYDVSDYVEFMEEYLKKAGKKFTDIGTSKKKIKKLLEEGYVSEAKRCRKIAKETSLSWEVSSFTKRAQKFDKKAGKKLKKIEMAKEEKK